eukprot:10560708-Alexandrium_andersonii.AAC.2
MQRLALAFCFPVATAALRARFWCSPGCCCGRLLSNRRQAALWRTIVRWRASAVVASESLRAALRGPS